MNNDILNIIINNDKKIRKSYFKNKIEWDVSRCRIDANFFVECILEYFLNTENIDNLTEIFLHKTRIIDKNDKEYKNSHGMDFNAIINWFKLSNNSTSLEKKLKRYKISDVEKTIWNYIDTLIKQQTYLKDKPLKLQWDVFCDSKSIERFNDIEEKIKEYMNNQEKELKVLEKNNIYEVIKIKNKNNITQIIRSDKIENELIGNVGEQLVYNYLIKKYGVDKVDWISKNNKYADHDFEVLINNSIRYIEVKSTSNYEMRRFFISRNEYDFYQNKKHNYDLYLVANIKYWSKSDYLPTLTVKEMPIINIDLKKSGYINGEFFIIPYNFIANW